MHSHTGVPTYAGSLFTGKLFFARQPEPDLEFTEEDLTDAAPQSSPPMKSPKPSNKRPILWLLLLALLGGLAYVAMDPDMVMRLLEPYLGDSESTVAPPPQQAKSAAPISPAAPSRPESATTPPAGGSAPPTQTGARSSPSALPPGPLFAEGQRVSVVPDAAKPDSPVTLFADSAQTRPGPAVSAGSSLTVLDGELRGSGWIYSVATEDGRQGWIAEKHLKFRR